MRRDSKVETWKQEEGFKTLFLGRIQSRRIPAVCGDVDGGGVGISRWGGKPRDGAKAPFRLAGPEGVFAGGAILHGAGMELSLMYSRSCGRGQEDSWGSEGRWGGAPA